MINLLKEISPEKKRLILGLLLSITVHFLFFYFTYTPLAKSLFQPTLREIHYLEEVSSKPSLPPKVRKLIEAQKPSEEVKEPRTIERPSGTMEKEIPLVLPQKAIIPEQMLPLERIELTKIQELAETQAPLDISKLEPSLPGEAFDIAIAPVSKAKTTEEILRESPIPVVDISKGKGVFAEGTGESRFGSMRGIGSVEGGIITLKEGIEEKSGKIEIKREKPVIKEENIQQIRETKPEPKVEIRGKIADRVKKRVLPKYPERARRMGWEGEVHVKVTVNPQGVILQEKVTVILSSGYPELDMAAKQATLQWVFDPLPPNVLQEDQEGIIIFRFILEF